MDVDDAQNDNYVGNSSSSTLVEKKPDKHALPWVEKYRPSSLDELIAHDDIRNILRQLISTKKLPHLLFYGPPGTGKKPSKYAFLL